MPNLPSLTNHQIKQSQKLTQALRKFYEKQNKDFLNIQGQLQITIQIFKKKFQQCQTNLQEIQIEWDKVRKFTNHGPGFLNAKQEEIKSKNKNIQSVSTGIKETVSKIHPQILVQLPVDKVKPLKHLFKTLFMVLYHKKEEQFNWETFKQLALKLQNGEDFISRLVNVHFKDFTRAEYQALLMLKNDPQFENISVNSQYAIQIIDLADWLEYVCVGHKFSQQKKQAQKAYDKIRKDIHRRQGGSLQTSKKFWKEALQQVDKFQMNLVSLDSQIKAFDILTQSSLDDIKERVDRRNQMGKV